MWTAIHFVTQLILRRQSSHFQSRIHALTVALCTAVAASVAESDHQSLIITISLILVGYLLAQRLFVPVVTGTIGSGKSTVIARIRSQYQHVIVIDADEIAKRILDKGERAYTEVVSHFGTDILQATREIDRKKLAKLVFRNEAKRKELNSITHWRIFFKIILSILIDAVVRGKRVVADIPLFFESPAIFRFFFHPKIVISSSKEKTLSRLKIRNPDDSEDGMTRRINSQMPSELKEKFADFVIRNDGSLAELYYHTDLVFRNIF